MDQSKTTNVVGTPWTPPQRENPFPELRPISQAPSLTTLNACGFAIYGKSDEDEQTNSYLTTHYFVVMFVPLFPIARYRVVSLGRTSRKILGMTIATGNPRYGFLGKAELRKFEKIWQGAAVATAVALLLGAVLSALR